MPAAIGVSHIKVPPGQVGVSPLQHIAKLAEPRLEQEAGKEVQLQIPPVQPDDELELGPPDEEVLPDEDEVIPPLELEELDEVTHVGLEMPFCSPQTSF